MRVKTSLGFSIEVNEDGRFNLPDRPFTTSELKKIAREVGRAFRQSQIEQMIPETEDN